MEPFLAPGYSLRPVGLFSLIPKGSVIGYSLVGSDEEFMKLWAELSVLDTASDPCNCVFPQTTMNQDLKIIKIPDGLSTLTADLLENEGERLILVIPSSVTEIDEGILTDNQIETIVSDTGTAAESFAKEQNIQFLIQFTKSVR